MTHSGWTRSIHCCQPHREGQLLPAEDERAPTVEPAPAVTPTEARSRRRLGGLTTSSAGRRLGAPLGEPAQHRLSPPIAGAVVSPDEPDGDRKRDAAGHGDRQRQVDDQRPRKYEQAAQSGSRTRVIQNELCQALRVSPPFHTQILPGRESRTPARRNDRSSFAAAGVSAGPAGRGHPNGTWVRVQARSLGGPSDAACW